MPDWAPTFLDAIAGGVSVTTAAARAGVAPTMAHRRRRQDAEFRQAWLEATAVGTEFLSQEVVRRGYHGYQKGVYYRGVRCGVERVYSDNLLMFELKKRDPSYRDTQVTINNGVSVSALFADVQERALLIAGTAPTDSPPISPPEGG